MAERTEGRDQPKRSILVRMLQKLSSVIEYFRMKKHARRVSRKLALHADPITLRPEAVYALFTAAEDGKGKDHLRQSVPLNPEALTQHDRAIIHRILHATETANRNNVTRTEAYRAFYFRYPELHWALLAHLVSRNGGWNMTDLKGSLLPMLLGEDNRLHTFTLLERANAAIFGDAYPQLLLYEASRKEETDLSHLLPYFGVSRFMGPVWQQFWRSEDSVLLTTALIVNEQHVIEAPLVQSDYFKALVLKKPVFLLQAPFQTNAVFMPYGSPHYAGGEMKLAGLVLENFSQLEERIEFGKRLYAILFGLPEVHAGVLAFVRAIPHTGSRADYAPHLFAKEGVPVNEEEVSSPFEERLKGCKLRPGAEKLYSPELSAAWPDVPITQLDGDDWFDMAGSAAIRLYFEEMPLPKLFEITFEHCMALNKLELAVQAKQGIEAAGKLKRR
ncbi:DUF2515 family protein [Paenibacillus sp. R14(2021)]|uniref:DUF2515 family protein n=1 Tax=Paenibacillus sp. R14(2021) TaxID=2859228 RepID=UPI001C616082|nr:DUF2515 family protein [Paenibacillus sp. R14(2021)]